MHYKRLQPRELLESMKHFCALEEKLAEKSTIYNLYKKANTHSLEIGKRILNDMTDAQFLHFWQLHQAEKRAEQALQKLLDALIFFNTDNSSHFLKTLREVRNQILPDGVRLKVRRFSADEPTVATEYLKVLERYSDELKICCVFENKTLYDLTKEYIHNINAKENWMANQTAEVRRTSIELERWWPDAILLFNRSHAAMKDEIYTFALLPTPFTHAFARAEELEIKLDTEVRHVGDRD